jgi:hypothetical protein
MELKTEIEAMLVEVGKIPCYDKRKQASFWVLDETPCVILDNPNAIQKRKAIEVSQIVENHKEPEEIGFIAIDRCLIEESNCDFVVFKGKTMTFCEDKMNISSKEKLELNVEKAMRQISNSKQYFNEQLFGVGKTNAFIGVPDMFTKNPNAYRSLQEKLTKAFKMPVKIGQKVSM